MRVIGAGFGRTGTASLKQALEQLGFGPCYHMSEIIDQPDRAQAWLAVAAGEQPDWAEIFAGYASTVDWPGAAFWRELVDAYPAAKVILTTRDMQRWYDSMEQTILRSWRQRRELAEAGDRTLIDSDFGRMNEAILIRGIFDGNGEERQRAIAVHERHIAEVRATVPADRLLTYQVAQGWQPLCDFLAVPVPTTPFPRVNDAVAFNQRQPGHPGRPASGQLRATSG